MPSLFRRTTSASRDAERDPLLPRRETTGGARALRWSELLAAVDASGNVPDHILKAFVDVEFPPPAARPDSGLLDASVDAPLGPPGSPKYDAGRWVECLHDDMRWHLEPIAHVLPRAEWEQEQRYRTASGFVAVESFLRAPEEGLKRAFGMAPWVWKQYALLRTEAKVRFKEDHELDFERFDFVGFAGQLYDSWLDDPRNAAFKALHDSRPEQAQRALKEHLLTTFASMDTVGRLGIAIDLSDTKFSCYQYLSVLGTGWTTALVMAAVQLCAPVLLVSFAARSSPRFAPPAEGSTPWDTFCSLPTSWDVAFMNAVVWIVYASRVVPSVFGAVYETLGDEPSAKSRLNSLRRTVWSRGADGPGMRLGYKFDRYFNSAYPCALFLAMLFVLFLTQSAIELVLNALAIEFLHHLDEEIAGEGWYDPGRRFLRGGAVELLVRAALDGPALSDAGRFCATYDVPRESLAAGPLHDRRQAELDDADPRYMDADTAARRAVAAYAAEAGNLRAEEEFAEPPVSFGLAEALAQLLGILRGGVLRRFDDCHVWSRWEAVLFSARVPEIGSRSAFRGLASVRNDARKDGDDTAERPLNFRPRRAWSPAERLLSAMWEILSLRSAAQELAAAWRRGERRTLPVRTLDAAVEWAAALFICLFPVAVAGYGLLILECQPIEW
ncbi:hypothetical protein DFJ74DRAFT_710478 [Hyaloraphidium curvatum]|nr:hypothetical protein DFJ74DRAFT_710478 [Hyaloraphidium curvatum]